MCFLVGPDVFSEEGKVCRTAEILSPAKVQWLIDRHVIGKSNWRLARPGQFSAKGPSDAGGKNAELLHSIHLKFGGKS